METDSYYKVEKVIWDYMNDPKLKEEIFRSIESRNTKFYFCIPIPEYIYDSEERYHLQKIITSNPTIQKIIFATGMYRIDWFEAPRIIKTTLINLDELKGEENFD